MTEATYGMPNAKRPLPRSAELGPPATAVSLGGVVVTTVCAFAAETHRTDASEAPTVIATSFFMTILPGRPLGPTRSKRAKSVPISLCFTSTPVLLESPKPTPSAGEEPHRPLARPSADLVRPACELLLGADLRPRLRPVTRCGPSAPPAV